MSLRRHFTFTGLLCAALMGGCASEAPPLEEPAPEPAAEPPPEAPAPAEAPPAGEEPTADELAVAEDFEAEVATAITTDNYPSELDSLEKEIDGDNEE